MRRCRRAGRCTPVRRTRSAPAPTRGAGPPGAVADASAPPAKQLDAAHVTRRRVAPDAQPRPAAAHVLPVLHAIVVAVDAFVHRGVVPRPGLRQRLVEQELVEFPRTAERSPEPIHSRTGNGPPPRSSSMWPVAKRLSPWARIRSGGVPVATKAAHAAPEAGMALK